ncbi:MAG TPA: efflux RND transporter periplasmic adaptor subunit [Rubrivivax sp.]
MKKRVWWVGVAALLLAAGVAGAVASGKLKLPGKAVKPDPVLEFTSAEVVRPALVSMPGRVEVSGPLVAPVTAIVRAKVAGTLLSLSAGEGSRVKAGQSLGSVDLADLGSRVAERSALLESARAALGQAERSHAQNERLAAQQFISAAALDSSRAAVDTARAQLGAAQAALNTTRVGVREAALVAPISGIVAKRHTVAGEKVAAEQPLLTIVDLSTLELAGGVGTHEVSRLAPGLPVQVRIEGHDKPVAAQIARIAPAADAGTRAIGVTIVLANPNELYRAGVYASASVVLADDTQRLTLPASAIATTGGQDHVWLVADGTLQRRMVSLGRRDERQGRVEVLDGVAPASQVLGARFENLREGARAVVVAARSAPAAAIAASTSLQ